MKRVIAKIIGTLIGISFWVFIVWVICSTCADRGFIKGHHKGYNMGFSAACDSMNTLLKRHVRDTNTVGVILFVTPKDTTVYTVYSNRIVTENIKQ